MIEVSATQHPLKKKNDFLNVRDFEYKDNECMLVWNVTLHVNTGVVSYGGKMKV